MENFNYSIPTKIFFGEGKIEILAKEILPIASILTLAATGSEMDAGAVITNVENNQKYGTGHPGMAPKFSILDKGCLSTRSFSRGYFENLYSLW